MPAPGDQRKAIARLAFGIGHALLAIGPALAQIILGGITERARSNPREVVAWTMCDTSAHLCSLIVAEQTTRKDLSYIYVGKGLFALAHDASFIQCIKKTISLLYAA
jgi:hypothetical protein